MLLLAIALIVIGPQKLPETARTIGKTVAQFRAYTNELKQTLNLQEQLGLDPTSYRSSSAGTVHLIRDLEPARPAEPGGPVVQLGASKTGPEATSDRQGEEQDERNTD